MGFENQAGLGSNPHETTQYLCDLVSNLLHLLHPEFPHL